MSTNFSKPPRKARIVVVLGPTSSGKSELAVKLAKKINGEIVSADSRQVYKYLNLSTGKVPGKWLKKEPREIYGHRKSIVFMYRCIPHHCIDFVSPNKIFTAQNFKKRAEKAVDEIIKKGKTPIIVGGTAFYIYALTGDIPIPEIPPDWRLRKKLEKKSTESLFKILKKLNSKRAKTIDPHNRRRLIRAIEIAKFGVPISKLLPEKKPNYDILWLGIKLPDEELKKRIKKRLEGRLKKGMIAEIKKVHEKYKVNWRRLEEMGLEMKYVSRYLRGIISKKELVEILNKKSWQFAKRQLTWWKKDKRIKWISSRKDSALKN